MTDTAALRRRVYGAARQPAIRPTLSMANLTNAAPRRHP